MLQSLNHLLDPSLEFLQFVYVNLALGSPEIDLALQVCLTSAEGKDPLSQPAGNKLLNTAQKYVDRFCQHLTKLGLTEAKELN